jgi:membrane protein involved in colicin uptake
MSAKRFILAAALLAFAPVATGGGSAVAQNTQSVSAPPTRAEISAIQLKIQRAWVAPADADAVRGLEVDLRVALESDGTVLDVRTIDQVRLAADRLYRAAAQSAEAAVRRASPLPVPRDKFQFFKQFTMRFVPPSRPDR